jgi:hypothetical protein
MDNSGTRRTTMSKAMGILLILALFGLEMPVSALGEDLDVQAPAKFYAAGADLLVARPLLAFGAVVPTAGFLATLPLSYPLNQDLKIAEYLVHRPWTYTADRALGDFIPAKNMARRIDNKISSQYQEYFVRVGANRSPDKR